MAKKAKKDQKKPKSSSSKKVYEQRPQRIFFEGFIKKQIITIKEK